MPDATRVDLSKYRYQKAIEMLASAKRELASNSYATANNRAYYSFEKSVKALLALKKIDTKTHSGVLQLFNKEYVHGGTYFTHEDYIKFKDSEFIRSASDYDDFYVASKEECLKMIENAEIMLGKVERYLQKEGHLYQDE